MFYGSMKWFDVDLDAFVPKMMPKVFSQARKLHSTDAERNIGRIIELLQPFVDAVFLPFALPDWEDHFLDLSGDGMPEVSAAWVRLRGVDFNGGDGHFPLAKMEAEFEVPVVSSFSKKRFERWIEENELYLFDAVSFRWRLPPLKPRGEPLFFPWLNHQGAECFLTNRKKAVAPKR